MTATDTDPTLTTETAADNWHAEFQELKNRFPGTKDSIVFCIGALQSTPDIEINELKAEAAAKNIRVTAASLTAAHNACSIRNTNCSHANKSPATRTAHAGHPQRARNNELDSEALIRGVVEKIEQQGNVEAERLKATARKAIAMLEAVVNS